MITSVTGIGAYRVHQEMVHPKKGAVETKETAKDKVEISKEAYEASKNSSQEKDSITSILNMSEAERAELVAKMKEEQEKNMTKLFEFVRDTLNKQGTIFEKVDDIWTFIASGEYTVDEQTRLEAEQAISEDGYYGVKKTSERIFHFALALTGGDEELMRKMEKAVEDGFKAAEEAWGGKLPSITDETYDAVKKLFNDYYESLE